MLLATPGTRFSNYIIQNALRDADRLSSEQGCRNINDYYQKLLNPVLSQNVLAL